VYEYEAFAERWAEVPLLVLGPGVPTGMAIRYDDPREVGPTGSRTRSRRASGTGAGRRRRLRHLDELRRRLGRGEFAGGVLAPGIEVSMDALFARAARLPKVPFEDAERVISQTTTAALQSGLVYGFAGQVDAIVERIREELGAPDAPVVATGGLAELIAPHSRTVTAVDPELTLQGLRLVWERSSDDPMGNPQAADRSWELPRSRAAGY
jgi:type III pantothenate kinase